MLSLSSKGKEGFHGHVASELGLRKGSGGQHGMAFSSYNK